MDQIRSERSSVPDDPTADGWWGTLYSFRVDFLLLFALTLLAALLVVGIV